MGGCDHILGRAFRLNPEEGPAWITPYIRESVKAEIADNDWLSKFCYCPVCGVKVAEPTDDDFLKPQGEPHGTV